MKNEILICRLITGEDVIGYIDIKEFKDDKVIIIKKGFVIIPTQAAKGQPIQLLSLIHI